jgi:hypothetical protein
VIGTDERNKLDQQRRKKGGCEFDQSEHWYKTRWDAGDARG